VARGTKWATKLVEASARRCCISHVTLLHIHRRLACRNQRSCLGAYVPWLIGHCTVMLKPLQRQRAQFRAGLGWHGWCFYRLPLHPLQTLLFAAFCEP
jgi:hypothetical protein